MARARFEAEGATVGGGDVRSDGAHGRIDILYNNAGAVRFGPIDEQSFADWRFTLAAELDSIFLACKHAWSHLTSSGGVPGMMATLGAEQNLLAPDHPMRTIAGAIPLRRLGTAEDIIPAAVFLCSDEAAYITGANLVIDGGWSVVLPGTQQTEATQ